MSLSVFTSAALDGSDRRAVESLSEVGALTYGSGWGGQGNGDTTCSFTVDIPPGADPIALTLGRRLSVYDGPFPVWSGVLAEPQRGAPWQLTAQGLASVADNYVALTSGSGGTIDPNAAVAAAISRGLPWVSNGGTIPTPPTAPTPTMPTPTVAPSDAYLGSLLDAVADASGLRWAVDPNGVVTMAADPVAPNYLLVLSNTPGSRTLDDFATDVYVKFNNASAGGAVAIVAATGNAPTGVALPFGRREKVLDATGNGSMTPAAAAALGGQTLAQYGPDPVFSGTLTILPQDLQTLGGVPAHLPTVRAGEKVRCIGDQPDPWTGLVTPTTVLDIVIGEWVYDATANTATLTPLGAKPRDFTSTLTRLVAATSTGT